MSVEFTDQKIAKTIEVSLTPDNVDFPMNMEFRQRLRSSALIITIGQPVNDQQVETLISTLDEIISHIHTAVVAIEKTENL